MAFAIDEEEDDQIPAPLPASTVRRAPKRTDPLTESPATNSTITIGTADGPVEISAVDDAGKPLNYNAAYRQAAGSIKGGLPLQTELGQKQSMQAAQDAAMTPPQNRGQSPEAIGTFAGIPEPEADNREARHAKVRADLLASTPAPRLTNVGQGPGSGQRLPIVTDRQYAEAIQESDRQQREQEALNKDQRTEQIKTENARRQAQMRGTGQQFYTDPFGYVQPVIDPTTGKALYHATAKREQGVDAKGNPAWISRDRFGEVKYEAPNLVASPDLSDDTAYADFGDGNLVPSGNLTDLLGHPDFKTWRMAKSALNARKEDQWKNELVPYQQKVSAASNVIDQAKQRQIAVDEQVAQLQEQQQQIAATPGFGDTKFLSGATPAAKQLQAQSDAVGAQLAPLLEEQTRLMETLKAGGDLAANKRKSELELALVTNAAKYHAYNDQIDELNEIVKRTGSNPASNQRLQSLIAARDTFKAGIEQASKLFDQAHAPQGVQEPIDLLRSGVRNVGGVPIQDVVRRYGAGNAASSPEQIVALKNRVDEIADMMASPESQMTDKAKAALNQERQYLDSLYQSRIGKLSPEARAQVEQTISDQTTTAGGAAARAAGEGALPAAAAVGGFEAGMALGAPSAPFTFGLGPLVTGAVGAALAGFAANKAQKAALKAAAPDVFNRLEDLRGKDWEQHPLATAAGQAAANIPSARIQPGLAAKGVVALSKIARGQAVTAAETAAAKALAIQSGLATAQSVVTPLVEGEKVEPGQIASSVANMLLFGDPRFTFKKPGGGMGLRPRGNPESSVAPEGPATSHTVKTGSGETTITGPAAAVDQAAQTVAPSEPTPGERAAQRFGVQPEAAPVAPASTEGQPPADSAAFESARVFHRAGEQAPVIPRAEAVAPVEAERLRQSPEGAAALREQLAQEEGPPPEQPIELPPDNNPSSDRIRYDQIQKAISALTRAGRDASDPQVQALWAENEAIKNRHEGLPPPENQPSTPESNAIPEQGAGALPVQPAPEGREGVRGENAVDQGTAGARQEAEVAPTVRTPIINERPALIQSDRPASESGPVPTVSEQSDSEGQRKYDMAEATRKAREAKGLPAPKPVESLPAIISRLGRDRVNELIGDWDWNANLSEDGRSIKTVDDPRSYTGKARASSKEFMSWMAEHPDGQLPTSPAAPERTSDKIIKALQGAKIHKPGELAAATPFSLAYDAAIDAAVYAIRAGRDIADAVKLAAGRFRERYPSATKEHIDSLMADIHEAASTVMPKAASSQPSVSEAPTSRTAETPGTGTSRVPGSLRSIDVPADDIKYEVSQRKKVMQAAKDIVKARGAAASEAMLADRSLPPEQRVGLAGTLIKQKVEELRGTKDPVRQAELTNDINRITRALQRDTSLEAGRGVGMHSEIYRDIGVQEASDYVRKVNNDRVADLGGQDAEDAAGEAAAVFNQTKDQAARDRAIEALKRRFTTKPVHQMLDALKGVETARKLNKLGVLTRDDMIEVAGNALGIKGPDAAKLKRIADLADRVENAKSKAQEDNAKVALAEEMAAITKDKKTDLETSLMTLNVLASGNTQAANAGGNAIRLITQLASLGAVNPGRLGAIAQGAREGLTTGVTQAKSIMQTGKSSRDLQDKTMGVGSVVDRADYKRLYPWMPDSIASVLNVKAKALSKVGRFMRAMDALAYYPAKEGMARLLLTKMMEKDYQGADLSKKVSEMLHSTPEALKAAQAQAASEGYQDIDAARRVTEIIDEHRAQNPDAEKTLQESEQFGLDTTYTNEPVGLAGGIYRAASKAVNESTLGGVQLLKPWMMFLKTPANMFNSTMDYTPLGAVRAATGMKGEKANSRREFTQDERNIKYLQASIGTALVAGLMTKAANDDIDVTFKGPTNAEQRSQLMASGWRPYSVRVGKNGTYMSYRDTPLLAPLAFVGYLRDAQKYGADKKDMLMGSRLADAAANALIQVPFATSPLTGMADLLGAASGTGGAGIVRGLASVPANLAIPGVRLAMEADRYQDPTIYDSNQLQQTIPFLRRQGTPRTDAQGRNIQSQPSDRFVGVQTTDPVDRVLRAKEVFIPGVGAGSKIGDRAMTDEEAQRLKRMSGQRIRTRLLASVARLQSLDKEKAQDLVDSIAREERAKVLAAMRRAAPPTTPRAR